MLRLLESDSLAGRILVGQRAALPKVVENLLDIAINPHQVWTREPFDVSFPAQTRLKNVENLLSPRKIVAALSNLVVLEAQLQVE